MSLRIAHCVHVAPRRSGLYETTRELCYGEIQCGHKAALIDTSWIGKTSAPTTYKYDRGVDIAPLDWARDADVHVLHSQIPPEILGTKPSVLCLHGAPEYVFYSQLFEHEKGDGGHNTLINYSKMSCFKRFVTFWPRHAEYWKLIYGDDKVVVCPPPCNMEEYKPEGNKYDFGKTIGAPNIGYCDNWRPTFFKDPFQIIAGVRVFWKKYPKAKLQIFGIPSEEVRMKAWGGTWDKHILAVKRQGDFVGTLHELFPKMADAYRALDVLVTSTADASRVLREALACGLPVVAPTGCQFTKYTCNIGEPEEVATQIERAVNDRRNNPEAVADECHENAMKFNLDASVGAFLKVLEDVCQEGLNP
jgi:glycosyltransferase involved in cell wall biosynthesis